MSDGKLRKGTVFGDYRIEGLIASGGMGQVYLARHLVYGHRVALKVLHPSYDEDPEWADRLAEEGRVGMSLKHPNIVSAREQVFANGRHALVLDLTREGQTLGKIIAREYENGVPLTAALDLFLQILGGMEYLHGQGIVHGDVKPENVLVEGDYRDPRTWVPKVTDFGTVAIIARPMQIDGRPAVVATPAYSSPEHIRGVDQIVIRSDIYCLGLLMHYLLTGRHASNARNVREAADRVTMPVPIVHLVHFPPEVVGLFHRMVAQSPNERFDSVRSLALAVRAVREALTDPAEVPFDDLDAALQTVEGDGWSELVPSELETVRTTAEPEPGLSVMSTEAAHLLVGGSPSQPPVVAADRPRLALFGRIARAVRWRS